MKSPVLNSYPHVPFLYFPTLSPLSRILFPQQFQLLVGPPNLDPHEDLILLEGTEQICTDLGVDPTDIVVLILARHLEAEEMCEFHRKGWMKGWSFLRYERTRCFYPFFLLSSFHGEFIFPFNPIFYHSDVILWKK